MQEIHPAADGKTVITSRRIVSFNTAPFLFDGVIPHEITHLLFRSLYITEEKIPLWANEGISMYEQTAGIPDDKQLSQTLLRMKPIPLILLMSEEKYPPYKDLFYLQSLSLARFLIQTFGMGEFQELVYYLSDGNTIGSSIGKTELPEIATIEELESSWEKWLKHSKK